MQKEKGTSPIWIAKKLHMNYSSINADARKASQPRIEDWYHIAKILYVNTKDLLKEE